MNVCLIIPPSPFLLDERVFVSLGILKVAAVLERAGHAVDILDCSGIANYEDMVRDRCSRPADWFGITATTPQMPSAIRILEVIRRHSAGKVMIGGPHPTLVNAAYKIEAKQGTAGRGHVARVDMLSRFDRVIAGDGEKAIFAAMEPESGVLVDADDVKGLLFLRDRDLDETPMPARHLIDMASYHYSIDGAKASNIIAQLGCPFNCGFCGGRNSAMLRRIRNRSTAGVLAEMRHMHEAYGLTGFMFQDDELNVNKQMLELMDGIRLLAKSLGTEFRLRGFIKSELFTEEQAAAMYAAGFRWILTGYESGSPRILDNINKKATREDNDRHIEIAKRHGLKVKALMSIGHPGESAETCQETEDWLLKVKPADFDVTIITTYPGTPYYDFARETSPGVWTYEAPRTRDTLHARALDYNTTADYYKGIPGEYKSYVFTDHLSESELVSIRDRMERRVRTELDIPYPTAAPAIAYEHSMGQK